MNNNSFNMEAPSSHSMIPERDIAQQIILACNSCRTHAYYFFHSAENHVGVKNLVPSAEQLTERSCPPLDICSTHVPNRSS